MEYFNIYMSMVLGYLFCYLAPLTLMCLSPFSRVTLLGMCFVRLLDLRTMILLVCILVHGLINFCR
jgi:hypothetical protein